MCVSCVTWSTEIWQMIHEAHWMHARTQTKPVKCARDTECKNNGPTSLLTCEGDVKTSVSVGVVGQELQPCHVSAGCDGRR